MHNDIISIVEGPWKEKHYLKILVPFLLQSQIWQKWTSLVICTRSTSSCACLHRHKHLSAIFKFHAGVINHLKRITEACTRSCFCCAVTACTQHIEMLFDLLNVRMIPYWWNMHVCVNRWESFTALLKWGHRGYLESVMFFQWVYDSRLLVYFLQLFMFDYLPSPISDMQAIFHTHSLSSQGRCG